MHETLLGRRVQRVIILSYTLLHPITLDAAGQVGYNQLLLPYTLLHPITLDPAGQVGYNQLLLPYTLLHPITPYYATLYKYTLLHRITLYAGAVATLKMITKETKMKENSC